MEDLPLILELDDFEDNISDEEINLNPKPKLD